MEENRMMQTRSLFSRANGFIRSRLVLQRWVGGCKYSPNLSLDFSLLTVVRAKGQSNFGIYCASRLEDIRRKDRVGMVLKPGLRVIQDEEKSRREGESFTTEPSVREEGYYDF